MYCLNCMYWTIGPSGLIEQFDILDNWNRLDILDLFEILEYLNVLIIMEVMAMSWLDFIC